MVFTSRRGYTLSSIRPLMSWLESDYSEAELSLAAVWRMKLGLQENESRVRKAMWKAFLFPRKRANRGWNQGVSSGEDSGPILGRNKYGQKWGRTLWVQSIPNLGQNRCASEKDGRIEEWWPQGLPAGSASSGLITRQIHRLFLPQAQTQKMAHSRCTPKKCLLNHTNSAWSAISFKPTSVVPELSLTSPIYQ